MFIGAGMEEAAIVALLDAALLTDEEMVRDAARRHLPAHDAPAGPCRPLSAKGTGAAHHCDA